MVQCIEHISLWISKPVYTSCILYMDFSKFCLHNHSSSFVTNEQNCSWQHHNFQGWLLLTNSEKVENHHTENFVWGRTLISSWSTVWPLLCCTSCLWNTFLHRKLPHLFSGSMQGFQRYFQCTQKMGWFWMTLTLTLQPVGVPNQQRRWVWTEPLLCLSSLWKVVMLHSSSSWVRTHDFKF